jgi:hypothetical protein
METPEKSQKSDIIDVVKYATWIIEIRWADLPSSEFGLMEVDDADPSVIVIKLRRTIEDVDTLKATLVHELLHALSCILDLEWSETEVRAMEYAFYPMIREFMHLETFSFNR